MECIARVRSIVESMENLHRRRSKLFESYVEILQLNNDLHRILADGASSSLKDSLLSSLPVLDGNPVRQTVLPLMVRVLQDMRQDIALLASLRLLLAGLRHAYLPQREGLPIPVHCLACKPSDNTRSI